MALRPFSFAGPPPRRVPAPSEPDMERPSLIVSVQDARRLEALLGSAAAKGSTTAPLLEDELLRAELREPADMPRDVVTMHSDVVCVDESTGTEHRVRLVYPQEADAQRHHVSVLAPLGAALLGMQVGNVIEWPLPGGRTSRVRVSAVTWQPEADGPRE